MCLALANEWTVAARALTSQARSRQGNEAEERAAEAHLDGQRDVAALEVAVEDSGRVAGERLLGGEVVLNLDVAALCHPLHECLSSV